MIASAAVLWLCLGNWLQQNVDDDSEGLLGHCSWKGIFVLLSEVNAVFPLLPPAFKLRLEAGKSWTVETKSFKLYQQDRPTNSI